MWKQGLRRFKNAFNAANPSAKSHLETRDIEARLHPCMDLTGKHTYGAEHLRIMQWGEGSRLIVGSFNSIDPDQTVFLGGNHRTDWLTTYPFGHLHETIFHKGAIHGASGHPTTTGDVMIKNDAWIGYKSTIMSGVTIGNGAVVAAHSVVTKNVPDYAIVAGNPAQIVKYRFQPELVDKLNKLAWWDLDDAMINAMIPTLQSVASLSDVIGLREYVERIKTSN